MSGLSLFGRALVLILALTLGAGSAAALKPISISPDQDRIEITTLGQLYEGRGDSLQVETAASADGTTGRMSVRAVTPGTNPSWLVFALTNTTDSAVERWLTADRYTVIGSGAVWPDLDARRLEAVTPSIGFVPERIASDRADVFRITLEPGQTITYIAELSSERFARIYLWKPLGYELKVRERQLFNGVMLGLTSLLAIFLTAIFAANHKVIFPAAALVAWCVLGYLCVDFGFFYKLFQLKPENTAVHRSATEAAMAASLVIFLYFFLRIQLWHGLARMLFSVWIVAQLALVAVAVIDPRLASTFARLSFAGLAGFGGLVTLFLALRGQDRALSLIPTWILFCVWVFGSAFTLTGQLAGDMVVSGLVAGLVLIVLLIGFTVTQFAFRSLEPLYGAAPSELQLRSAAVEAAGAAVWEWSARRDEIKVGIVLEAALGLNAGELNTKVDDFCRHMHPADRERFRLSLVATQERNHGRLQTDFRMRHADNSYRWYSLDAAPVPSSDGRTVKCVGLLRDVTDQKRAHERLVFDAVKCRLTGLPNKEILLDRLNLAVMRAKTDPGIRPTILFIDLDKFKSVNSTYGVVVGDSLLLTVARRLQRHLEPNDTISRIGGDQFAILLLKEQTAADLAALAERVRRSLRSPIKIAGQEIVLTGSLGIAIWDGQESGEVDLLREAEIAMYRAKRSGTDRIEIFRAEMRGEPDDRALAEAEIRKVVERNQLKLLYQPIVYLPTEELAGFEVAVRWEHGKQGLLDPLAVVEATGNFELMRRIAAQMLMRAAKECSEWQKELPRSDRQIFVSFSITSEGILEPEFAHLVRQTIGNHALTKGSMKIAIRERIVMDNPERATEVLEWLRGAGADLVLEDFGSGYSSLPYLGRLPFETFKLDGALLEAEGGREGASANIVRAMVMLAHELGRKVVVEGVESDEEIGFLRSIECEYAQGHYYGEPISERDVLHLLKLVRKSERRMQPRGLFRATLRPRKPKAEDEAAPAGAVAVKGEEQRTANGAGEAERMAEATAPPAPSHGRERDGNGAAPPQRPVHVNGSDPRTAPPPPVRRPEPVPPPPVQGIPLPALSPPPQRPVPPAPPPAPAVLGEGASSPPPLLPAFAPREPAPPGHSPVLLSLSDALRAAPPAGPPPSLRLEIPQIPLPPPPPPPPGPSLVVTPAFPQPANGHAGHADGMPPPVQSPPRPPMLPTANPQGTHGGPPPLAALPPHQHAGGAPPAPHRPALPMPPGPPPQAQPPMTRPPRPMPKLRTENLPPSIRASLERLAGREAGPGTGGNPAPHASAGRGKLPRSSNGGSDV